MKDMQISTVEAVQKLREPELLLPTEHTIIHDFSRFMADRLDEHMTPQQFVDKCDLAIADLRSGKERSTGKKIHNTLTGHTLEIYQVLRGSISTIAKKAFPKDFAQEVERINETTFGDEGRGVL